MKRFKRISKGLLMTVISIVLFAGTPALGAETQLIPGVHFFVTENTHTMPRQDTFTILRSFEENGYTFDQLNSIRIAVFLEEDYEYLTITDQTHLVAVWKTLSDLKLTARGAERAGFSENPIYIDFHFVTTEPYWNYHVGIEIFGPVHVLGRGPFIFAEGSSAQPFIDLFTELTGIPVDITQPEPIAQHYGYPAEVAVVSPTAPQVLPISGSVAGIFLCIENLIKGLSCQKLP